MKEMRSIWLIGGGAALGLLALCALVAVGAAVAVIWFSSSRTSSAQQATQAAVVGLATSEPSPQAASPSAQNTAPPTSATPRAATSPTPLPLPGTLVNLPTLIVLPTQNTGQNTGSLPPAEEAVRAYYDLVGSQRYDVTWPMLTDDFKQRFNCCRPNYNYTGYVEWWDSVDRVEVGRARTVSQNGNRAVVYTELTYIMNNGNRSATDSSYIALVYDANMGSWRFDDKRANP